MNTAEQDQEKPTSISAPDSIMDMKTLPAATTSLSSSVTHVEKGYDHNGKTSSSLPDPPAPIFIPDGGLHAWLTIIGSAAAMMATYGVIFSIGTLQTYLATHQLRAFPDRDVGWIPAVNIFICMILAVQCGPMFDRLGPQWLLLIPSLVFISGMVAMSFTGCSQPGDLCSAEGYESTRAYVVLMLTWGVACGVSAAFISTAALAVVAHWFEARRGLAAGLVYAGTSIGGVAFPLLMRTTLEKLGWGWSVRILALIALFLLVVANLLIRGRTKDLNEGRPQRKMALVDLTCFEDMRFLWATIGISLFEYVVTAALGMLPTWATIRGFDNATAFAAISAYNGGSCAGRVIAGALSDRFGRFNTVIAILILSVTFVFGLWLPVTTSRSSLFYTFAAMFGFTTGSIMSMAPVCIGQLCDPHDYGRYLGTSYSLVSLFCLVSIPISAEIMHNFGTQVFCVMIGIVIFAALMAFVIARWAYLQYRWKWRIII